MADRRWLYLAAGGGAALLAAGVAAFALTRSSSPEPDDLPFHAERPAATYLSQQICSLADQFGNGANISGQDGGTSLVVDGVDYWFFADTLLPAGGFQPNNIATSMDFDASDCLTFQHKVDGDGNADRFLGAKPPEVSVWPAAGEAAVGPGYIHFLYSSVVTADNITGWHRVRHIGIGKLDTAALTGERVVESLVSEDDLPDDKLTLTPAVDMLVQDGYVYVYFAVNWNVRVGRAPVAQIEDKAGFRYWDGTDWVPEVARSVDILRTAAGQQAFNIAYSPYVGKWTATYSSDTLSSVAIAYADAPEGPFDGETVLIDCAGLTFRLNSVNPPAGFPPLLRRTNPTFADSYRCYHATQHPELDPGDRQTIYITYGNLSFYRLFLHRIVLGVPFVQWDDTAGDPQRGPQYAREGAQVADATRRGVAFYAPAGPGDGLTAIHHWFDATAGVHRYEATSPGAEYDDLGAAFYATLDATPGLAPVYRWTRGVTPGVVYATFDLTDRGYTQEGVAFYAATLDGQRFYDADSGYVYWVRMKGRNDFGCCGSQNNPTRQTDETSVEFTLQTEPSPDGYEAIVCSPVCGTNGKIVWSGDVSFEPPWRGGKLVLTPKGPK